MTYNPAAGSKLLGSVTYDPGTIVEKSLASIVAMTAFDTTNARITFTAPASGKVQAKGACLAYNTAAGRSAIYLGVLDGATVRLRQMALDHMTFETFTGKATMDGIIDGLTPGSSYTFDLAYGCEQTGGALRYGGPNNTSGDDAAGALTFEVWEVKT